MHAMQTLCKLSCPTAKVGQRLSVSSGNNLCHIESRPSFSAASSACNTAVLTPSKVAELSQKASTWSSPLRVLAATTMAAVVWLGPPTGRDARAEGISSKVSEKAASLTSSNKGASASAIALDKLPPLPFAPDALEPFIDTATMQIHHDKHHQTYITKLQTAISQAPTLKGKSLDDLNKAVGTQDIPSDVTTAVRNNGGGHWNHSFFWNILTPAESKEADYQVAASDELKKGIEEVWGSLNAFQAKFNEAATAVFGSGWAWLGVDDSGTLVISTTSNQDNPLMKAVVKDAHTPILGLDVWEHAYYLKYQNKRPDYLNSWWHVVNWKQVSHNLELAKAGKTPATA